MEQVIPRCPDCESLHIVKSGFGVHKPGEKKQRYMCRDCGRTFYLEEDYKK
ncbi:unnamed protein product [marine sediment metagenome]|uniref:InsA N-terminal domain-containing protein n=1 Tax=marine sediment metagenome TaxID=412755 RepID=X1GL89_9ZZZZ